MDHSDWCFQYDLENPYFESQFDTGGSPSFPTDPVRIVHRDSMDESAADPYYVPKPPEPEVSVAPPTRSVPSTSFPQPAVMKPPRCPKLNFTIHLLQEPLRAYIPQTTEIPHEAASVEIPDAAPSSSKDPTFLDDVWREFNVRVPLEAQRKNGPISLSVHAYFSTTPKNQREKLSRANSASNHRTMRLLVERQALLDEELDKQALEIDKLILDDQFTKVARSDQKIIATSSNDGNECCQKKHEGVIPRTDTSSKQTGSHLTITEPVRVSDLGNVDLKGQPAAACVLDSSFGRVRHSIVLLDFADPLMVQSRIKTDESSVDPNTCITQSVADSNPTDLVAPSILAERPKTISPSMIISSRVHSKSNEKPKTTASSNALLSGHTVSVPSDGFSGRVSSPKKRLKKSHLPQTVSTSQNSKSATRSSFDRNTRSSSQSSVSNVPSFTTLSGSNLHVKQDLSNGANLSSADKQKEKEHESLKQSVVENCPLISKVRGWVNRRCKRKQTSEVPESMEKKSRMGESEKPPIASEEATCSTNNVQTKKDLSDVKYLDPVSQPEGKEHESLKESLAQNTLLRNCQTCVPEISKKQYSKGKQNSEVPGSSEKKYMDKSELSTDLLRLMSMLSRKPSSSTSSIPQKPVIVSVNSTNPASSICVVANSNPGRSRRSFRERELEKADNFWDSFGG